MKLARDQGFHVAVRRGRVDIAEDFMSEAVVALLVEWPKLVARYDVIAVPLVRHVVARRLLDWCRVEFGRDHWKPHAQIVGPILDHPPAPNDTAAEATKDMGPSAAEIIDLVMAAQHPPHPRRKAEVEAHRRRRLILLWVSEGRTQAWMSRQLHITESAVSLLIHRSMDAARKSADVQKLGSGEPTVNKAEVQGKPSEGA